MAVVHHLRVESALIDEHLPQLRDEQSWAWRFFEGDDANWLDAVRMGRTPPNNGAGGNRLLYRRALELAIRTSSGGYNPFIDRLFELHGSGLFDEVWNSVQARQVNLGRDLTKRMPDFATKLRSVCVRQVRHPKIRYDHCWCDECGKEDLVAHYNTNQGAPANVCAWCGWIICSKGSCQKPGMLDRFDLRTGAQVKPERCRRRVRKAVGSW
jgi:hypothetical protein